MMTSSGPERGRDKVIQVFGSPHGSARLRTSFSQACGISKQPQVAAEPFKMLSRLIFR